MTEKKEPTYLISEKQVGAIRRYSMLGCSKEADALVKAIHSRPAPEAEREHSKYEKRMNLRRTIHKAGHELFESLSDIPRLQNIAGEFQALNEYWALSHDDTYGYDEIIKTGYLTNQKIWIKELADQIRSRSGTPEAERVLDTISRGKSALYELEPDGHWNQILQAKMDVLCWLEEQITALRQQNKKGN